MGRRVPIPTEQIKIAFVIDRQRDGPLWDYLMAAIARGENMSSALRVLMLEALEIEHLSQSWGG